jgi:DNA repair protein RAD5
MESPHPDERPPKKRRFFAEEDSSPIHVPSKPSDQAPHSPSSPTIVPDGTKTGDDAGALDGFDDAGARDGFDVGMLQAVVGELPSSTLQRLKHVSSSNVERGMQ